MHLLMLLKFGTTIRNDGLQRHVIYFRDQIQDGRLVAILLLKCVPNHCSDLHGLILLKLATSTVHDGIHVLLNIFSDLIKDGQLAAILVVKKKTRYRTRPQPILRHAFTDRVKTWHTDIE